MFKLKQDTIEHQQKNKMTIVHLKMAIRRLKSNRVEHRTCSEKSKDALTKFGS